MLRLSSPLVLAAVMTLTGCFVEFADVATDGSEDGALLASESQQIVGGSVNRGDPAVGFVALVAEVGGDRRIVSTCTATLVSAHVMTTARHCVQIQENTQILDRGYVFPPGDVLVFFGTQPGPSDVPLRVVRHEYHPSADLAVLQLEEAGPAAPVPLNTAPLEQLIGQEVRIAGFGITETGAQDSGTKRVGTSTLLATDADIPRFGELAITGLEAGQDGELLCSGDSGGPTFMTIGGAEYIIGVNSFVARNAGSTQTGPVQCQDPDTFNGQVRVDRYVDWINEFIVDAGDTPGQNPEVGSTGNGGGGGRTSPLAGGCAAAHAGGNGTSAGALFLLALLWGRMRRRRRRA